MEANQEKESKKPVHKCYICSGDHYTRDCEYDEQWHQEVLDGCFSFWYCDHCGEEFLEEDKHKKHQDSCCYKDDKK